MQIEVFGKLCNFTYKTYRKVTCFPNICNVPAVITAILPQQRLGIALKIDDGTTRASDAAIAALLVHLGVLAPDHPTTQMYVNAPQRNWRGITTGRLGISPTFLPQLAQI